MAHPTNGQDTCSYQFFDDNDASIEFGVFVINSSKKDQKQLYDLIKFDSNEFSYKRLINKLLKNFSFLKNENFYLTYIGKVHAVFFFLQNTITFNHFVKPIFSK